MQIKNPNDYQNPPLFNGSFLGRARHIINNYFQKKHAKSAFAGILLASGISIYALVPEKITTYTGEENSRFGESVSVGDINNDFIPDILTGLPNTNTYAIILKNIDGTEKERITKYIDEVKNPIGTLNNDIIISANPSVSPEVRISPDILVPPTSKTININIQPDIIPETETETPAPTEPAPEVLTPVQPTSFISKVFASQTNEFGSHVFILGDINNDNTVDFLINNHIIINNSDFTIQKSTLITKDITHLIKNNNNSYTTRYSDGTIRNISITETGITENTTITSTTTSLSGGYDINKDGYMDYIAGTPDNNIRIILMKADNEIKSESIIENPDNQQFFAYGDMITLLPDINNDLIPDIAIGIPSYDNNRGLVLIHTLKKTEAGTPALPSEVPAPDLYQIQDTLFIENPTSNLYFGLSLSALSTHNETTKLTLFIGSKDSITETTLNHLNGNTQNGKSIQSMMIEAIPTTQNIWTEGTSVYIQTQTTLTNAGNMTDWKIIKNAGVPTAPTTIALVTEQITNDTIKLTLPYATLQADTLALSYTYTAGAQLSNIDGVVPSIVATNVNNYSRCTVDNATITLHIDDCGRLGLLYAGFNNDLDLVNWMTSTAVTGWTGITTTGVSPNKRVSQINVNTNTITGAMKTLNFPSITVFNAHTNQLTGSIPALPASLTQFHAYSNQLTGSTPALPASLTYFHAANNQLTGSIPALPASLTQFHAYSNQLTGSIPLLPVSLTQFSAQSNQLVGPIPLLPAIMNHLNVAVNQITGSIPALPASLTQFQAYTNQITGSIPALPASLTYFHAGNNQLTGSIPALPASLTQFYAYSNQLTGSIPILPASLTQFHAYSNQLTGSIPSFTLNTVLDRFYVNGNQLTGTIPTIPTSMLEFIVNNNLLTGPIPSLVSNTAMNYLWVNNNNLSGSLSGSFGYSGTGTIDYRFCSNKFDITNSSSSIKNRINSMTGFSKNSTGVNINVTDTQNCQTQGSATIPSYLSNGMNAYDVIGQYDHDLLPATVGSFVTGGANNQNGVNDLGYYDIYDIAYDKINKRMIAADATNNRVLIYNLDNNYDLVDKIPDYVIGQPDFKTITAGTTASKLSYPFSVAYDNANLRLFVSDYSNNRILTYDFSDGIINGESAVNVIGQPDFTSNTASLQTVKGVPTPTGIEYSDITGRIYVGQDSGGRVTIFDARKTILIPNNTTTNNPSAVNVIGQIDFTSRNVPFTQTSLYNPHLMDLDDSNNKLYVVDRIRGGVVVYDVRPSGSSSIALCGTSTTGVANGMNASCILGQPDFVSSGWLSTATRFNNPRDVEISADGLKLYVSQSASNRISVFDLSLGISNGQSASWVLGQTDFTSTSSGITQSKLNYIAGMALQPNGQKLYATDVINNRIMIFDVATIINGEPAVDMIGQYDHNQLQNLVPDYTKSVTNNQNGVNNLGLNNPYSSSVDTVHHRLFTTDYSNNRVLIFNLDLNNNLTDKIPDYVLGQTNYLNSTSALDSSHFLNPSGLAYDSVNDKLFVQDQNYNRILVFNLSNGITNGMAASNVLGQTNFTSATSLVTSSGLSANGSGISYDSISKKLFVTDYNFRVLIWDLSSGITNGMVSSYVLGQTNFTSNTLATSQTQFAQFSGNFYIGDVLYAPSENKVFVSTGPAAHRILVWDLNITPLANGIPASYVLGQTDFVTGTSGFTNSKFNTPRGMSYDPSTKKLFVSDTGNNRISVFDLSSGITNGMSAVNVIGQPDFTTTTSGVSQSKLNAPINNLIIDNKLLVSDYSNNRIMMFNTSPIPSPAPTFPQHGSSVSTDTITFTGTGSPTMTITIKNGNTTLCTATVSNSGNYTCNYNTALTLGMYNLTITQSDSAGVSAPPLPYIINRTSPNTSNGSGGTSPLLSQRAREEKLQLIRGVISSKVGSVSTATGPQGSTTNNSSVPVGLPNTADQYGNPIYTVYRKDSKGGVLINTKGQPVINKRATEKAKGGLQDPRLRENDTKEDANSGTTTVSSKSDLNLTDKETLSYPALMKKIQVFITGGFIEKELKPIEISRNKLFITKYQETVRKQKVLSNVKLPNNEQVETYLTKNETLRNYFCKNLQTMKTLTRGVYNDKNVKILQQFYGYILHIPIEIDTDYGTYMNTLGSLFHTTYQDESTPRQNWTNGDSEFVKDTILSCEN